MTERAVIREIYLSATNEMERHDVYNCGCGKPEDEHDNSKNITNKTFKEAAQANKMTVHEAKAKTKTLLSKVLVTKPAGKAKKRTA